MRRTLRTAFLVAIFATVSILKTLPLPAQHQQVLDRIAAIVDDEIILMSEVTQGAYLVAMQMGIDPMRQPQKFEGLKRETLDNLIAQKVLLTEAKAETVKVDDKQIDQLLNQQMQTLLQRLGSEEKVEEYFGQPVSKVRRSYRQEIVNSLMIRNLQQQRFSDLKVSRREVEKFYETHRDSLPELKESVNISHILVEVKPGDAAEKQARQKAERLRERIIDGEDFAVLAKQYSEDPGTAQRGGELGFMSRGDFVKEFEETAFALEPGQVSEVVRTRLGYHVIQCIDRRGDKVNVRHILIKVPTLESDEIKAVEKIKDIHRRLVEGGEDFAEMAKEYSDDATTKDSGGLLGWYEIDNLAVKEFRAVAETLKVGEISEPFRTDYGYHVMRMNDRQEARPLSLERDWDKIESITLQHKQQEEFNRWLQRLKEKIYIEVKEG